MKKFIYTITFLLFITIISGCTESNDDVLKVGMELKWPPFETVAEDGSPEGVSVMIAKELGDYLGKEVEIVDLPFSSLIPALETEQIDLIIGSMSITEERKQSIDFSDSYMYFKILSVVNKESGITSIDDIFSKEGLVFVAPKSFATLDIARNRANNPEIREFDDKTAASLELANGNADVFLIDAVGAISIAANYPDNLSVVYEPVMVYPIGMGIRKSDSDLLEQVNEFIAKSDELGVNERIADSYDDILKELVGKGYEFYLNED